MRTRIYIDGYNFYYGCLKKTPYKWLNLPLLFEKYLIPRSGSPAAKIIDKKGVKFFTAEISERVATDVNSVNDQRRYHSALKNHCGEIIDIVKGSYAIDKVSRPKVELDHNQKEKLPKDCEHVKIWKFEEKQSDVNVAVESLFDALTNKEIKQVIFVTNDTDIVPALKKIKEYNITNKLEEKIIIGLVIPVCNKEKRKPNKSLIGYADWHISSIEEHELENSQLPYRVVTRRSTSIKPTTWFKYPQQINEIIEILSDKDVLNSDLKAWKWLMDNKKPVVEGLESYPTDIEKALDDKILLKIIISHVKAFAEYQKKQNLNTIPTIK